MSNEIRESMLYAESMLGTDKEPKVKISSGISFETILTVSEAREFALKILEMAEAAETDKMIWHWLETIEIKDELQRAAVLKQLRNLREK